MNKEELLDLIRKGEANLVNQEGKDVSKAFESPDKSELTIEAKLDKKSLTALEKLKKEQ